MICPRRSSSMQHAMSSELVLTYFCPCCSHVSAYPYHARILVSAFCLFCLFSQHHFQYSTFIHTSRKLRLSSDPVHCSHHCLLIPCFLFILLVCSSTSGTISCFAFSYYTATYLLHFILSTPFCILFSCIHFVPHQRTRSALLRLYLYHELTIYCTTTYSVYTIV